MNRALAMAGVAAVGILALTGMMALASAQAPTPTPSRWVSSFVEDGWGPGEYTFVSVQNLGTRTAQVRVKFLDMAGTSLKDTSTPSLAPGASWNLFTRGGGAAGLPWTEKMRGRAQVTTDTPGFELANLNVWSAVVFRSDQGYSGFTGKWTMR